MSRKSVLEMKDQVLYASSLLAAGTPMYVFDLETTGLNAETDRIVSFSALKIVVDGGIGRIDDKKDIFINPGFHIPEKATSLNGITDEQVKDCPPEEEAAKDIRLFLGERPFLVGYYSKRFDENVLNAMYLRVFGEPLTPLFHLDVWLMAKEKLFLSNYKLSAVAEELGVNQGLTFHHSMDDVIATYRCFDVLRIEYEYPDVQFGDLDIKIKDVRYWDGPRWNLKRVYVTAYPPYQDNKIYYDVARKTWVADDNDINLDRMRKNIFHKYGVADEAALVMALR